MATKNITWESGGGNITASYGGSGNGQIIVTSSDNTTHSNRSQTITVKTTDGAIAKTITVSQQAKPYISLNTAVVTAPTQTYNGSAITPAPTVTLDGVVVSGSNYDVTWSSNVNAGTATITVTGKGDYTGTATGTFTIAKANRTVSFSNPTTSVNTGSTVTNAATVSAGASDGTLTYSSSNTSYATVNNNGVVTGVATGNVTITATISGGLNYNDASGSYSITVAMQPIVTNYTYKGSEYTETLQPGTYVLECWGAQGGYSSGGKGGYAKGTLVLTSATTVYIYVGGSGTYSASGQIFSDGGFNGGGRGYSTTNTYCSGSGGGASDIRVGQDSLYARVIVAGGGGGAGRYNASVGWQAGGAGGGTSGINGVGNAEGANGGVGGTQQTRGTSYYGTVSNNSTYGTLADFGVGGGAISGNTSYRTVGGGGGWYGGGYSQRAGAGGGSGYVLTSSSYKPSGYLLGSDYYLSNAETIDGDNSFPSTSGGTETGHTGNGYIRITQIA